MPHLLLPKLNTQHTVPSPASAGVWNVRKPPVLDDIAAGLVTDIGDYFNVDAIPDVWARPLLFEMALYDKNHQLHDRLMGEWRGMCAVFALHEWRGFALEATSINLTEIEDDFGEVALKLMPTRSLFDEIGWEALYVLTYKGHAIGMTSPTTLFCTAHDYAGHSIPWFDGKRLCDPLKVDRGGGKVENVLSTFEREALYRWLERLKDNLRKVDGSRDESLWSKLLEAFQDFQADLGDGAKSVNGAFITDTLGISDHPVFRHLDETPPRPEPDVNKSHVVLASRRTVIKGEVPELLILEPAIADQWGLSPQDVIVWGHETLDSAVPYGGPKGPRDILAGQHLQGVEWRTADDFFTDTLYIFRREGNTRAFANVTPVRGEEKIQGSPVIPINPEILKYIYAQDLARDVEYRRGGKGIQVRLSLPLSGASKTRVLTIEKEYRTEDIEYVEQMPVLEVWPAFESTMWDEYYTFYKGVQRFFVNPAEGGEVLRTQKGNRGMITERLAVTESFPEALLLRDQRYPDEGLGVIVLDKKEKVNTKEYEKWKVGVDFGTTSTNVYVRSSLDVNPIIFEDRIQKITESSEAEREDFLASRFIPIGSKNVPINSFYQTFGDITYGSRSLENGNIYYVEDGRKIRDPSNTGRVDHQVWHDLKWSNEARDKVHAKQFLQQVVMQIRVEAAARGVKQIDWTYSTPSSFSRTQERDMERVWEHLIGEKPSRRTESLATAVYFRKEHDASTHRGAVCIDIGGMSADIAVWQGNEVKAQSSVKLASREIFVKSIIESEHAEFFGRKILGINDINIAAIEIALTSKHSPKEIENILMEHGGGREIESVHKYIVFGVGALFFYAGLMVKDLIERGRFNVDTPYVYLAGNGSQMLHWLTNGKFDYYSPVAKLFTHIFSKASGLSGDKLKVSITPSDKSKHEVAAGLVYDHPLESEERPVVISALEFKSDKGLAYSWNTEISEEKIAEGVSYDLSGDNNIIKLISIINKFANNKGLPEIKIEYEDCLRKSEDKVSNRFSDLQNQPPALMDVESPFIVGIRSLMNTIREK